MFTLLFSATQLVIEKPTMVTLRLTFGPTGRLNLRDGFSRIIDFTHWDKPTTDHFELPENYKSVDLGISISTKSTSFEDHHGLIASHLGRDDTLVVTAVAPNFILGNILHNRRYEDEGCEVRCADGKASQGCITCQVGDVYMRLCC
jgi:hypothetical protein